MTAGGSDSAYVPDLPGRTTCGDTADAVRRSIGDAVASYADALRADELPEPTTATETVDAAKPRGPATAAGRRFRYAGRP